MDAREIMIGNIVCRNNFFYKVDWYDEDDYEWFEPMEIRTDFLLHNGFKEETNGIGGNEYNINLGKYHIKVQQFSNTPDRKWSVHIDNDVYMTVGGGDVQYVHQLQNLVKVLTGEDLFIKVNAK